MAKNGKPAKGARAGRARRGKGESMTGSKEGAVEVRTVGDNSSLALPAPDDYDHHMRTIKGLKEKSATAASLLRHAKTSANKCCPGLAASIEETLSIEREGDPIKLQRRLELMGIGLKRINSTVQLAVFDTLEGDQAEFVASRFYKAGKAGATFDCKYPETSDLYALAKDNWVKGQAELMGVDPPAGQGNLLDGGEHLTTH